MFDKVVIRHKFSNQNIKNLISLIAPNFYAKFIATVVIENNKRDYSISSPSCCALRIVCIFTQSLRRWWCRIAVAEDFVGGSGVFGGYILHGGGGYELRLTGEVLGGAEQIGIMW